MTLSNQPDDYDAFRPRRFTTGGAESSRVDISLRQRCRTTSPFTILVPRRGHPPRPFAAPRRVRRTPIWACRTTWSSRNDTNLNQESGPFRHSKRSSNLKTSAVGHWGNGGSKCRAPHPHVNAGSQLTK